MPFSQRVSRWIVGAPLTARYRRLSALLGLALLLVIGLIVLTPGPPDPAGQSALQAWLDRMHARGSVPGFITFGLIEWLSNVVMFVPLGFLGAAALPPRHRLPLVAGGAALLSVLVEVIQLLFLPQRTASVGDVLANVLGASIGAVSLAWATSRSARRRSPRLVAESVRG